MLISLKYSLTYTFFIFILNSKKQNHRTVYHLALARFSDLILILITTCTQEVILLSKCSVDVYWYNVCWIVVSDNGYNDIMNGFHTLGVSRWAGTNCQINDPSIVSVHERLQISAHRTRKQFKTPHQQKSLLYIYKSVASNR